MNAANDDPQNPAPKAAGEIGPELNTVAQWLNEALAEIAGAPVGFALIVFSPGGAAHVSNAPQDVCAEVIRKLLTKWVTDPIMPPRIILPH